MRSIAVRVLTAGAFTVCASAASAQPVNGFYMSGGFGAAFPHARVSAQPAAPGYTTAPLPGGSAGFGPGGFGQGSVGYGFGNGLRFEVEGSGGANHLRLPQWP